jgi:molecular chaperone GrpE (heat shock protein)
MGFSRLNSSLNVKVEELSAQIASLNIENLRLRAEEQTLARKLRREKERTRRLVGEAEAAVSIH